jgi:hypothetical protein
MAKKSTMSKAADAVKTVACTALGAAAAAATQVVVESVVDAVSKGGAKLDAAGPELQKSAPTRYQSRYCPARRGGQREQRQRRGLGSPSELRLWPKRKVQPRRKHS